MNCIYGPYQIISNLERVNEGMFRDGQSTRQVAVFSDCSSITTPCPDAVLLHRENHCPDCDVLWYECPSELGRIYTIIATPCGVTITSFEDGLIALGSCNATVFGSSHFCFGKVYSTSGIFDNPDQSTVIFNFDGHTFTVTGTVGICPDDLFTCDECNKQSEFSALEELPKSPPDASDPNFEPDDEEEITEEDTPPTEIIPGEGRARWIWNAATQSFGIDTECEEEKPLTDWPGGSPLPTCASNDNPSIATLPSGHTIVAYEERNEAGSTKISLAILSSSVHMDVRYYRKLSRGTLLNNLAETGGIGHFEIYDDILIESNSSGVPIIPIQIGFLTGPLAGTIRKVIKFTRSTDKARVISTFHFSTQGQDVVFPDKNDIHNIQWFLLDNQGSPDLPPPNQSNIISTITLPDHLDSAGNPVPVANPSIAVASNNLMTQPEQVIYVTYQAYESNQWRVYLREIVLGGTTEASPIYLAPYLFDVGQRQIEITPSQIASFGIKALDVDSGIEVWDYDFSSFIPQKRLGESGGDEWLELADTPTNPLPSWEMWSETNNNNTTVSDSFIYLCDSSNLPSELQPCFEHNPSRPTCIGVWNNRGEGDTIDHCVIGRLPEDNPLSISQFNRTLAQKVSFSSGGLESNVFNFFTTLRFCPILNLDGEPGEDAEIYPEVFFWWGRNDPVSSSHAGQWRLQILRGKNLFAATSGVDKFFGQFGYNVTGNCSSECFVFRLYDPFVRTSGLGQGSNGIDHINNVENALWHHTDTVLRTKTVCVDTTTPDYVPNTEWNEWRVESYLRGRKRHFDIYLNNSRSDDVLMAQFSEWDPLLFGDINANTQYEWGNYHGFGFGNGENQNQVIVDRIQTHELLSPSVERQKITVNGTEEIESHIFYEDDIMYDGWLKFGSSNTIRWTSPFITNGSLLPSSSHHLYNFAEELQNTRPVEFHPTAWTYTNMIHGLATGNAFYPSHNNKIMPPPRGSVGLLDIPVSSSFNGLWSLTMLNAPTYDLFGNTQTNNVSMTISAARLNPDFFAYPHVWFVMRNENKDNRWWRCYRVRITKIGLPPGFLGTLPAATTPNGGNRPEILPGEQYWKLSLYKPQFVDSGFGTYLDPVDEEVYIKIVSGTPGAGETNLDWIDFNSSGTWPYFRVDFSVENSSARLDVYVGEGTHDLGNADKPAMFDNIAYELLYTFNTEYVGGSIERPWYGFALFGGSNEDPELDNRSVKSDIILNYVKLEAQPEIAPPKGICCRSVGGCEDNQTSEQCVSEDPNNVWIEGETCSNFDCTTIIPTGAACKDSGAVNCIENVTEAEANSQGFGLCTGCEWQEGVDCETRACPEITTTGACCIPGGCVENLTFSECSLYFGIDDAPSGYWRETQNCPTNGGPACPSKVIGACCLPQGCRVTSQASCIASGGTWQGDNTHCNPSPCTGACCDGTTCYQADQPTCEGAGDTFIGYDVTCSPNPCITPDLIGACCFPDGNCLDVIESACPNGVWHYDQICSDDPCPDALPVGACCDPITGACEDSVDKNTCIQSGRNYQGDGSTCALINCPQPTGACCVNLICQDGLTFNACSSLGGTYLGNFSQCIPNICTQDNPYITTDIIFKPEDVWRIEVNDEEYITRVKYHMQEELIISSSQLNPDGSPGGNNSLDFMFIIDHSGSMIEEIFAVQNAVPSLAEGLVAKGFDVRFGFVVFGRGITGLPEPKNYQQCGNARVFNGLQAVVNGACASGGGLEGVQGGFTRSFEYLQDALNCWGIHSGSTSPWATIDYAINDSTFEWRDTASKFIFFVTDTHNENECDSFGTYVNDKTSAKNHIIKNGIIFIPAIDPEDIAVYQDVAEDSGWDGEIFNVNSEDYGLIFETVVDKIDSIIRINHSTIMERAQEGIDNTFLKPAEVIITYKGDLTDLWTFNKNDFTFKDDHVPFPGTSDKGLSNFPFTISDQEYYGIDPVHIQGIPENWVSFGAEGPLNYDYPNGVGLRASAMSEFPILISNNAMRPKVFVNNRNQVIVAYENYTTGTQQIEIKGTGDFHQDSITGPKASRIQRFLMPRDFAYHHAITLPTTTITSDDPYTATTNTSFEGLNQLCDFIIDNSDITHIVWQSNRDGYWEIYYANSYNLFKPVRLTKAKSRSAHPAISVDESGNIFVVYHDDRFGPFNIMLASKKEERVIPLLEQDAYMASLRNKYSHYTNILPVFIDNPTTVVPKLGQFWATKRAEDPGNDNENYLYKLNETTGVPFDGINTDPNSISYIAVSSNAIWGIESDKLFKLGTIGDNKEFSYNKILVGTLDLAAFENSDPAWVNSQVVDMAVDTFDRIWILIHETKSGIGIGSLATNNRFRLEYINSSTASTVARGILFENIVDSANGASLAITSDNRFYITRDKDSEIQLMVSDYPIINSSIATFSFNIIGNLTPSITPVSMTANALNVLHVVTDANDMYTISQVDASTTFLVSLTSESGAEDATPVGTTSGIAYQNLEAQEIGGDQYFHIRIDFYDNINFEGKPYLSIDSRENLEAFINDEILADPYFDPYGTVQGLTARGIFIPAGSTGIVFFDATHFVPGFSRLAQPFSFEPNQTYFPRVFAIDETGNLRESNIVQTNSFSCTKCSRFGNNNFNSNICAYSFVTRNESKFTRYYNFQIDFYADTDKQHLIRRFEATPGSNDLAYMEVDNIPATQIWTDSGLPIEPGEAPFIQIHPVLDPQAGFLCGVLYTVQVNQCFESKEEQCSDFSILTPENWISNLVGGETLQTVSLTPPTEEVFTHGLSMAVINNKLGIVWIDDNHHVIYAEFDGKDWAVRNVFSGTAAYVSLASINSKPAISVVIFTNDNNVKSSFVLTLNNRDRWSLWAGMSETTSGNLWNPRSLIEFNKEPMTTFITTDSVGQAAYKTPNSSGIWDTDQSCGDPPIGSCLTDATIINGLPAVVYIANGQVRYAEWNFETGQFSNQTVYSASPVYWGHMGIAEINRQPAVAYIKVTGNKGQIVYARYNGTNWQETVVTGPLDLNRHIDMVNINDVPNIVYSVKQSPTTSQLKYARLEGTSFINETIDEDLSVTDPIVQISEFENRPVVTITANPFRIYFFRQEVSTSNQELSPIFFCECASKIFTNRLTPLHEVTRWESSAHGFADTRVTDSTNDSVRPIIKTRTSNAAIIVWEDYNVTENCSNPPCIRAATFRNANQDQLRGSGTESWFDYDFGISGQDPAMTLDLYDRVNLVYEKPKSPDPITGYHGKKLSINELPGNTLYRKVCDFSLDTESSISSTEGIDRGCDLSSLEANIISFDHFISNKIVRKIKVKDKYVSYYTYNASGVLTPIVSTCNLILEIHGTPEIVALRLRNENSTTFSSWCAWSPQIGDFVMEKEHTISAGSGVKEVCVQAMTYAGITTEFCIPIVADYETIIFESKFYKNTPEVENFKQTQEIDGELFFPADLDDKLIELPLFEGISVANLAPISGENFPTQAKVLVEIIPNKIFTDDRIIFDVIQQGSNDMLGLVAQRGKNNAGRVVYRGDFIIEREDNVFNIDGLARVNPTFQSDCEEQITVSGGEISDQFNRDKFNIMGKNLNVETSESGDVLADYRQTVSGRVGVTIDIRTTSDDPYFIFGDPNYSLKQSEGNQTGVPFKVAKTEISVGETVEQEVPFCPPPNPNDPNLGCPEGTVWDSERCSCIEPAG